MNERRQALSFAVAMMGTTLAQAQTPSQSHDHHAHHHHHSDGRFAPLVASASACITTGEACLAHCLVLLESGDTAMAACAKLVSQTLAVCAALRSLAGQQSRLTGSQAKVALEACNTCADECRKHAAKHAECKACLEACEACAKDCKAFNA